MLLMWMLFCLSFSPIMRRIHKIIFMTWMRKFFVGIFYAKHIIKDDFHKALKKFCCLSPNIQCVSFDTF
jgi:hypothetical protein